MIQSLRHLFLISCLASGFQAAASGGYMGPRPHALPTQTFTTVDEESPFMVACKKSKGLFVGRPVTGLLKRSVPEKNAAGLRSRDFLSAVIVKVRERIMAAQNQMNNIEICMDRTTPKCDEINHWVSVDLAAYVKNARFNLSLGQSPHQWMSWLGLPETGVNELEDLGDFKLVKWAPLTAEERSFATGTLQSYMNQIRDENQRRTATGELKGSMIFAFTLDALIATRYQHYLTYHQMLSELPLLQHLSGPEVSPDTLKTAFKEMRLSLELEIDIVFKKIILG